MTTQLTYLADYPVTSVIPTEPKECLALGLRNCREMLATPRWNTLAAHRGMCESLIEDGVWNREELQRLLDEAPASLCRYKGALTRSLLQRA